MLLDLSAKFDLVPLAQVVRPLHAVAMPLGAEFFLMGPLRATLCCCTRMASTLCEKPKTWTSA